MTQTTDSLNFAPSKLRLRPLDSGERERHASWLELFFDLVFVLAVAQVAHVLNEHSDFAGTIKFLALFVPVWWSWVGFTFYADRFETNEAIYRILTFAAILAVAALAVNLENAFSAAGDAPFVFCYVFVRVVLIALYIRAAYHVRSPAIFVCNTFTVSALPPFCGSPHCSPPRRFVIGLGRRRSRRNCSRLS
jgi:low temperature requirement protein LtrA